MKRNGKKNINNKIVDVSGKKEITVVAPTKEPGGKTCEIQVDLINETLKKIQTRAEMLMKTM